MSTTGKVWPWSLLLVWAVVQVLVAQQARVQQRGPIDFLSYQIAATNIVRGESPYATVDEDLTTWRAYHALEHQLRDPRALERPVRPGPYLYPPTLALVIAETRIGPRDFVNHGYNQCRP